MDDCRRRGHWIDYGHDYFSECSECGSPRGRKYFEYCQHCGSRMYGPPEPLTGSTGEEPPAKETTRSGVLYATRRCVVGDRDVEYGPPEDVEYGPPEDVFADIADLWSAYAGDGRKYTVLDVAHMMVLLKMARAKHNPKHTDNYVDIAGYAACAAELAEEQG